MPNKIEKRNMKKDIKKLRAVSIIFVLLFLSGCSKKQVEDSTEELQSTAEGFSEEVTEELVGQTTFEYTEYLSEPSKGYQIKSVNYDLGKRVLKAEGETDTPYNLRGILSYPSNMPEGKLKPVLILHGCHDNFNERRYDTGFQYLTDYLAENGYLAVSMDVNAAYDWNYGDNRELVKMPLIFEEQMNLLKDWDQGGENSFGIELQNRIDFDNILLIGHSTAGEIIFKIAAEEKYGIKNLLCVAPTYGYLESVFDIPLKGLAIVVPEYDGDVAGLDGLAIQNQLIHSKNQEQFSTTFLKKANHNYFNTVLEKNDAESTGKDITDQLTKEEQQEFLKKFVVSNANETFFNTDSSTVNRIDGFDVLTDLRTNQDWMIADANTAYITKEQIKVQKETDSVNFTFDTAPGLNMALVGDYSLELSRVEWSTKAAALEVPLTETDFSVYQNIDLSIMLNPDSEFNVKDEAQGMSIVLTDQLGKKQKVVIPGDSNAIFYPKGKMDSLDLGEAGIVSFWDGVTVSSDIRIPLSGFNGLDTKSIVKMELLFDQKETGSIYIQSIYLMK